MHLVLTKEEAEEILMEYLKKTMLNDSRYKETEFEGYLLENNFHVYDIPAKKEKLFD